MEEHLPSGSEIALWPALRELYWQLSRERRREFVTLLGFMLVGGVVELATIGSVIPFLALLSQRSRAVHLPWPAAMLASHALKLGLTPILAAAVIFGAFAVVAGLIRLQLAWLTQKLTYRAGHELALGTQRRILSQPYTFHLYRNSSTLISATDKIEVLVFDLVLPIIQSFIAAFLGAFLLMGLLLINLMATLIATTALLAIYGLASVAVGKRLVRNSAVVGTAYHERLKVEQESLGGIRDVIIDKAQPMHLELFNAVNSRLAGARASTNFMAQAPRFIVESVGIVIVVGIALLLSARPGGVALALPFLGALAVGAQRLLPLAQTVYAGWTLAAAHTSIVTQVIDLLRLPLPSPSEEDTLATLPLNSCIRFDDVSFSYPTRVHSPAVASASFEIHRGSMVAFVGATGSGKTTLADLLMGLIEPTGGQIAIDGVQLTRTNAGPWQRSIAHVPQSIFLADTSVARNVALSRGQELLDLPRVSRALQTAKLDEFVASLPEGYDTIVGERGVRLSGGQRQRLGLARAIYKDAPILVLDEATSALDEVTEAAVMEALAALREKGHTIIIIAHRPSTLAWCQALVCLREGQVAATGSYAELVAPPFSQALMSF